MATTVHIPPVLLETVQKRARALGVSRNRLIVRALEREVSDTSVWTPGFLESLRKIEPDVRTEADRLLAGIRRNRRSRRRPPL